MDLSDEPVAFDGVRVGGNKAVAARILGISRRAFYRQLERHGLHERTSVEVTA